VPVIYKAHASQNVHCKIIYPPKEHLKKLTTPINVCLVYFLASCLPLTLKKHIKKGNWTSNSHSHQLSRYLFLFLPADSQFSSRIGRLNAKWSLGSSHMVILTPTTFGSQFYKNWELFNQDPDIYVMYWINDINPGSSIVSLAVQVTPWTTAEVAQCQKLPMWHSCPYLQPNNNSDSIPKPMEQHWVATLS
jgi:hypothetical protein